ncbi:MAG TPA: hypothetical protein VMY05_04525 [Acidobacteriota bacterium]|nr:hypothetical protein [Acidobacteriota bacterium]
MRVGHVTEEEIQAYLDERRRSGRPSVASLLAEGHFDGCVVCRETLRDYEYLYKAIPTIPEPSLSPDFTNRVASRLEQPVQVSERLWDSLGTIVSPFAAIIALLLSGNIAPQLGHVVLVVLRAYFSAKVWWSGFALPGFSVPDISIDLNILSSLNAFVASNAETGVFALFVCVTLLAYSTVDRLVFRRAYERL